MQQHALKLFLCIVLQGENNYDKNLLTYKYEGIKKINKKIKKDDKLGSVSIYYDEELLESIDIYLERELEYKSYVWIIIPLIIVFILMLLIVKKGKNKKR